MKLVRLLLTLLAISLTVFGSSLVYAQTEAIPEAEGTIRGFDGEVVAEGTSITGDVGILHIKTASAGEEKTIRLTAGGGGPDYQLKMPGRPAMTDVAEVLEGGTGVAVLAQVVDGQWAAVQVAVKPETPTVAPATGVVLLSDKKGGTFTIMTSQGNSHTLRLSSGAAVPSDGELVTVFIERRPEVQSEGKGDGPELVQGLARAAEISQRLQSHLDESTSEYSNLVDNNGRARVEHVESLSELLE